MILTHTIKYEAVKMTCKEICEEIRSFNSDINYTDFYDPKDKEITSFDHDSWDWLFHQKPNKIVYLLNEISDSIKTGEL